VIRIGVADLRVMGRATQGVRLITFKGEDEIASIAKVAHEDESDLEDTIAVDGTVTEETPDVITPETGVEPTEENPE
jgi:DNA gyrase subunit A